MLRREVAEKVKPPRALFVEFGWGQPLGPPREADTHRAVALEALRMAYATAEPAAIWDFHASPGREV